MKHRRRRQRHHSIADGCPFNPVVDGSVVEPQFDRVEAPGFRQCLVPDGTGCQVESLGDEGWQPFWGKDSHGWKSHGQFGVQQAVAEPRADPTAARGQVERTRGLNKGIGDRDRNDGIGVTLGRGMGVALHIGHFPNHAAQQFEGGVHRFAVEDLGTGDGELLAIDPARSEVAEGCLDPMEEAVAQRQGAGDGFDTDLAMLHLEMPQRGGRSGPTQGHPGVGDAEIIPAGLP